MHILDLIPGYKSRVFAHCQAKKEAAGETEKKKKTYMENIGNVINDGKANAVEGKRSKGIGNVHRHRQRQSVDLVAKPSWQGRADDEGEGGAKGKRRGSAPKTSLNCKLAALTDISAPKTLTQTCSAEKYFCMHVFVFVCVCVCAPTPTHT